MANQLITVDRLNEILNKHSLGKVSSPLTQLTNGWTNITIRFTVEPFDRQLIVRQYLPGRLRSIKRENIEFELNFIKFLFEQLNLPVAPMLEPPGLLTIDDDIHMVIFPFIDGIKYLDTANEPVRQLWQTLEISRFLGRMHSNVQSKLYAIQKTDRCSVNYVDVKYQLVHSCQDFNRKHPDLYKRIMNIIDKHTGMIPLTDDKNDQATFEKHLQEKLPIGYIHADIHDDNVLFRRNEEKLAAVLDFDDMYVGALLIDTSMTLCLWSSVGAKFNIDFGRAFLLNYEKERGMRLTEDEWNLLEIYCYLTTLNQVLFIIEAERDSKSIEAVINDLLLPIECIGQEEKFLEKLRSTQSF